MARGYCRTHYKQWSLGRLNEVRLAPTSRQPEWTPPPGRCICGLEARDDDRCALCEMEGCCGFDVAGDMVWDGKTYPSRRKHRVGTTPYDNVDGWSFFIAWWFGTRRVVNYRAGQAEEFGQRQEVKRTWLDDLLDGEAAA